MTSGTELERAVEICEEVAQRLRSQDLHMTASGADACIRALRALPPDGEPVALTNTELVDAWNSARIPDGKLPDGMGLAELYLRYMRAIADAQLRKAAAPVSNATEEGDKKMSVIAPLVCQVCKKTVAPSFTTPMGSSNDSWFWKNVAPDAASGGTLLPVHHRCLNPLPVDNNAKVDNQSTHKPRFSDSSMYDYVCEVCGAKDLTMGPNEMAERPCKAVDNNAGEDLVQRLEFIANETHNVIPEEIESACDAAVAELERLRKALERYGDHREACSVRYYNLDTKYCDCGLDVALQPAVKAEEGGRE